jgi:hypothetical protein
MLWTNTTPLSALTGTGIGQPIDSRQASEMSLIQLHKANGSWARLKAGWKMQCIDAGEDFGLYARGTFIVLDELADKPERKAGIFAVQRGDEIPDVICQVNTTPLPGHPEPVLRVRMVTVCPAIDFGTFDQHRYVETLADLFFGIVELSQQGELAADEFKLHLRSPEDFNFFRAVSRSLSKLSQFSDVQMHGAWLHVSKG